MFIWEPVGLHKGLMFQNIPLKLLQHLVAAAATKLLTLFCGDELTSKQSCSEGAVLPNCCLAKMVKVICSLAVFGF